MPCVHSTRAPDARDDASDSSADLPTPGSPRTTTTPPRPAAASANNASSRALSQVRPHSMPPTLPSGPDPFQSRSRHRAICALTVPGNPADGVLANGGEVGAGPAGSTNATPGASSPPPSAACSPRPRRPELMPQRCELANESAQGPPVFTAAAGRLADLAAVRPCWSRVTASAVSPRHRKAHCLRWTADALLAVNVGSSLPTRRRQCLIRAAPQRHFVPEHACVIAAHPRIGRVLFRLASFRPGPARTWARSCPA